MLISMIPQTVDQRSRSNRDQFYVNDKEGCTISGQGHIEVHVNISDTEWCMVRGKGHT